MTKTRAPIVPIQTYKQSLIPPDSAPLDVRTRFTKDMVCRAIEDAIPPHELLRFIALCPDTARFTDWTVIDREWTPVERGATMLERIDCAKAILPYYASKMPVEIAVVKPDPLKELESLTDAELLERQKQAVLDFIRVHGIPSV